jgi:hypothetical protein
MRLQPRPAHGLNLQGLHLQLNGRHLQPMLPRQASGLLLREHLMLPHGLRLPHRPVPRRRVSGRPLQDPLVLLHGILLQPPLVRHLRANGPCLQHPHGPPLLNHRVLHLLGSGHRLRHLLAPRPRASGHHPQHPLAHRCQAKPRSRLQHPPVQRLPDRGLHFQHPRVSGRNRRALLEVLLGQDNPRVPQMVLPQVLPLPPTRHGAVYQVSPPQQRMVLRVLPLPRFRPRHHTAGVPPSAGTNLGAAFSAIKTTSSSMSTCHPNAGCLPGAGSGGGFPASNTMMERMKSIVNF